MRQDLLQAVVKVEKKIQRHVEAERNNAAAWLDGIRQSCRQEIEATRAGFADNHTSTVAEATKEAECQARQKLALADCKIKALQSFPEDILEKIIAAELSLLLPDQVEEAGDDR